MPADRAYFDNIERLANEAHRRRGSELQRMFRNPPPRRREPVTVRQAAATVGLMVLLMPAWVQHVVRRKIVGYFDRIDLGRID